MSVAEKIMNDTYVAHYGVSDMFRVYYTCFPVSKKKNTYECIKGKFDPCYSDTRYYERDWKETSVPKLIPEKYHPAYLHYKNPEMSLAILKKQ